LVWLLIVMIWLFGLLPLPTGKERFWLNFMGNISLAMFVIALVLRFVRHVMRLGKGDVA
jgi:hypothetical protein